MKKLYEFKNGLSLAYYGMPEVRSVSMGVFVRTGSVSENATNNGISHFIEHTMFKGTKKRTAFDIVAETDNMGAAINAFTSKTVTCYYIQCVDSDIEKSAEILSDIYFNSVFPDDELNKEKGVVLEEIAMSNDIPDDLSYEMAATAFYKGHPIARPILGTRKNVQSFTREMMLDYIGKHYSANNTVISISGNVSFEKAVEIANRYFTDNFARLKGVVRKKIMPDTQSVYVKKFKKIEQGNINILFPSTYYDSPLMPATRILNTVFGYGLSSRLYQQIRERMGLAYSVYSYLSTFDDFGHSMIYLGTNVDSVEKAVAAIRDEISNIKRDGITKEEFKRGKAQMKSGFVFGCESSSNMMLAIGRHAARNGELLDVDELIGKIDAVTMDDISQAIAESYDVTRATVSYVGPKFDKNLLEILQN